MIDFRVQRLDKIIGGLTFQLTYDKKGFKTQNSSNNLDYSASIAVREDAFFLIEPIFSIHCSNERTPEQKIYYHYGLNYHDTESLESIVKDLKNLKEDIEKGKIPAFLTTSEYRIPKKIKKILTIPRIRYKYQNEMLVFIGEISNYLSLAIDDDTIKGAWVLGI